jgi:hypothetical protein
MYSTRYSCQIVTKFEISRQIFEKYSNKKFRENSSSGGRVVPCGRTDRHDKANSRFSQFCERACKARCNTVGILAGDIGPYSELYKVPNVHEMYVARIK